MAHLRSYRHPVAEPEGLDASGRGAIEGNTLTEEQVSDILRGTFQAPPSRAYQAREVKNVLDALDAIAQQVLTGDLPRITPDLISDLNRQVLEGTDYEPPVVAGKVRYHSVVAASYRGAPAEDCHYLLERLSEWLDGDTFRSEDRAEQFALTVLSAIYAHLYLAWIHPYGDGNGRTARLLEFLILARSTMVPIPAANLLSNHYNLTRDKYYKELSRASQTSSAVGFLSYATQGLLDGLRGQIEQVREQQLKVTWISYVHQVMGQFAPTVARDRQRSLVLALPSRVVVPKDEIPLLAPRLAAFYATTGPRTLSRDLNRLLELGLVVKHATGWQSNEAIIEAFRPPIAEVEAESRP